MPDEATAPHGDHLSDDTWLLRGMPEEGNLDPGVEGPFSSGPLCTDELSVNLLTFASVAKLVAMSDPPNRFIAFFQVQFCTDEGLEITYDPNEPGHSLHDPDHYLIEMRAKKGPAKRLKRKLLQTGQYVELAGKSPRRVYAEICSKCGVPEVP